MSMPFVSQTPVVQRLIPVESYVIAGQMRPTFRQSCNEDSCLLYRTDRGPPAHVMARRMAARRADRPERRGRRDRGGGALGGKASIGGGRAAGAFRGLRR